MQAPNIQARKAMKSQRRMVSRNRLDEGGDIISRPRPGALPLEGSPVDINDDDLVRDRRAPKGRLKYIEGLLPPVFHEPGGIERDNVKAACEQDDARNQTDPAPAQPIHHHFTPSFGKTLTRNLGEPPCQNNKISDL